MKLDRSSSTLIGAALLLLVAIAPLSAATKPLNGKIVFVSNRDGNNEIYVMNPDGSEQTRMTNTVENETTPSWSPDGTKIAFTRSGDITVMNADGTDAVRLTDTRSNGFPAWSPDGTRIAFQSFRDGDVEIYTMAADGSSPTRLTEQPARDGAPSWSPDATRIVFASERDGNSEIYIMNSDGSDQTRLTENTVIDQHPHFSPDGKKIVFTRFIEGTGTNEIMTMHPDGTHVELITNGTNSAAAVFSPDGRKMVFQRRLNDEIFIMDSGGQNPVQLTNNPAFDTAPSWQPVILPDTVGVYRPSSGQWLLRTSNSEGNPDLTLVFGGQPGDLPVAGDWNGDGRTDIGIFNDGLFRLAVIQRDGTLQVVDKFRFGQAGDRPIAGDWDGDGVAEVGVYRDGVGRLPSTFLLRVRGDGGTFNTEEHAFGTHGDLPLAGDWNADGLDTIGVFHAGVFLLTDDFGEAGHSSTFGSAGDQPIAGAWRAGLVDGIGLFHWTGFMFLETQVAAGVDFKFEFGAFGDIPVAGQWATAP